MARSSAHATATAGDVCSRAVIFKTFLVIAAITFLLRIWYAGNLYQDDGLWFITAEELLRGKALYREIFFDKPPGLPLVYAALFKGFGAHILTIRLFTIFYSILVSTLLYRFGSRFYDSRTGLAAAAMFSVFSTTYISGDMQSLNTDFLMAPFYTAGAYLVMRSCSAFFRSGAAPGRPARLAIAGGCMTGLAFQINPKGSFDLVFLALLLIAGRGWVVAGSAPGSIERITSIGYIAGASRIIALAAAGFMVASLPFVLYIAQTHSLSHYKLFVWDLSAGYASYYPLSRSLEMFLRYGTDYFLINNTLSIALIVVVAHTIRQALRYRLAARSDDASRAQLVGDSRAEVDAHRSDWMLLIWFAISYAGVAGGGRFFAHYYFQVLPSLCLLGARGSLLILSALEARNKRAKQIAIALMAAGFLYTLIRSHTDTARLVSAWVSGRTSGINREARIVAAMVRDVADPADAVDRICAECIRDGGPRTREARGPSDYLFVWGNWPEIYYWSGLLPASRYVGVQPLTGLAADLQYGREEYRPLLDASLIAAARAELARDLELTPPKYIVDELGFRDERLSILRYQELSELMKNYERLGTGGEFPIYERRPSETGLPVRTQ